MFKYKLGEEVRYTPYPGHTWYLETYKYEILRCHYTEFMSEEGELLYKRAYDLVPVLYHNKIPSPAQKAGHTCIYISEDLIVGEQDYQKQLIQAAATASP